MKNKRAQSTLEYAVLIACLAGALIAMQIYVKRSIQGRVRDAADEIGEQYSAKHTTSIVDQKIYNPENDPVVTTGKTVFKTDEATGDKYEITEITRHENTTMEILNAASPNANDRKSYEVVDKLSNEELFE